MSVFRRRVVLGAMIALFLGANLFLPGVFWNSYRSDLLEYCAAVAIGALVSEVCLLAIWGSLGAQALKFRLPLTMALVVVAACFYVMGLQFPDDDMPLEVSITIISLAPFMYCCLQAPFWIVRSISHQQICLSGTDTLNAKEDSAQFSLRYLMAGTAVVGALLTLGKYTLADGSRFGDAPWGEILGSACIFIAFSTVICLPCVGLALAKQSRTKWAILLALVLLFGPLIVAFALGAINNTTLDAEDVFAISCFSFGAAGTTLLALFIASLLGYRLMCPQGEPTTPTVDAAI